MVGKNDLINRDMLKVSQVMTQSLIQDLCQIVDQTRNYVATTVNHGLTLMYWHIGERINRGVLENQRAEYGKQIVVTVARQLQVEYGAKGKVAQYLTELPSRDILKRQIQKLLECAKARFDNIIEEDEV